MPANGRSEGGRCRVDASAESCRTLAIPLNHFIHVVRSTFRHQFTHPCSSPVGVFLPKPRCLGHTGDHVIDGQGILAAACPATHKDMNREKRRDTVHNDTLLAQSMLTQMPPVEMRDSMRQGDSQRHSAAERLESFAPPMWKRYTPGGGCCSP